MQLSASLDFSQDFFMVLSIILSKSFIEFIIVFLQTDEYTFSEQDFIKTSSGMASDIINKKDEIPLFFIISAKCACEALFQIEFG